MPSYYSKLFYHIIWTTKYKEPIILNSWKKKLFTHMQGYAESVGIELISINAIPDHIHVLVKATPSILPSKIVNYLKGESSHWINSFLYSEPYLYWQRGYAILSVNPRELKVVKQYIASQEQHHRLVKVDDEIDHLLTK